MRAAVRRPTPQAHDIALERALCKTFRVLARAQRQHTIVNQHILAGFLYLESYFETPRHILKDAGPYVCICK
jgi:hypothetical protein